MKPFKIITSLLLSAVFLVGLLPLAALPAAALPPPDYNGSSVLQTLGHTDTDTFPSTDGSSVIGDSRDIPLHIPFRYADPNLNLSAGLNITYDKTLYKNVVASADTLAIIDDLSSPVELTVTFNMIDEEVGAAKWETIYYVTVVHAAEIVPTFSGTLLKDVKALGSLSFTPHDFEQFYEPHDGDAIRYISIRGSNTSFGTLKLKTDNYTFDTSSTEGIKISLSLLDETNIGHLNFVTSDIDAVSLVSYDVKAYTSLTSPPIGNVVINITAHPAPKIVTPFIGEISKGATGYFELSSFTDSAELFGVPLESLEITPTNTSFGTWYLGTTKMTATTQVDDSEIGSLSFLATAPGTATFSWSVTTMAGTSAAGTGIILVKSPILLLTPHTSKTRIIKGSTASIALADFRYEPDETATLTFIKITTLPVSADGTLILSTALPKNDTYGYPAIAANAAVPLNAVIPASYISYLRLTTKSTCPKNQVSFMWTATADVKALAATWGEPVSYTVPFMTTGLVEYTTDMNIPVTFSSTAFISAFPVAAGSPLSYVTFTLPDKTLGSLFLNYNVTTKTGTAVSAAVKYYPGKTPNLSNITLVPGKDYTGIFELTYTAYMENGKFITGTINVTVSFNIGGTLSYIADKNSALHLDAKDFQTAFFNATGKSLSYISFPTLPSTSLGTLYYDVALSGEYESLVQSSHYYDYIVHKYNVLASPYISLVSFVPYHNFTGTVSISFTGYVDSNTHYDGKLVIFVVDSPAGIVSYPVKENGIATLSGADFSKEFIGVTGSVLSYVTFTPPVVTNGSLYFQYDVNTQVGTKIAAATKYFDGKIPDISDITYIPPKDFVGTIVIPYKAFTTTGASYEGKLKFTIYEGSSVISYSTESGKAQPMIWGDFANAFYMNSDGKSLSYVTFDIPSSSYGKLYYNYTSPTKFDSVVSNDKKYYISAAPYISNVAFVPQETYSGTFYVTYTGYTSNGASFTGKIKITVRSAKNGSIIYETNSTSPVTFKSSDFITAFSGKSTYPLSYVRFSLPYESYGLLYYNYNSQASYNERILPTSNYPVSLTSYVTLVPNRDFSGVLAINYIAFDTIGNAFPGTILVTVKSNDVGTITYGTSRNKPALFNAEDFNTAFLTKTGSPLDHVTFTLPSSAAGILYLGYISATSYTSKVAAATNYYRSYYPQLSNISFVPFSGFTGTVTIQYTAYPSSGSAYYGKIIINVGTTVPFEDMDAHEWAKEAVSYLYRNGIIADDDSGHYYPGVNMTRADFVVMMVNAFNITGGGSDNFPDVPEGSDYYDAVSAAQALGIVYGGDGGMFYPQSGITRQDAMVIIIRALDAVGMPLEGAASDLSGFPDASTVSGYAIESVAALVRTGLIVGTNGKLNPLSTISRAEIAVILYRILTM